MSKVKTKRKAAGETSGATAKVSRGAVAKQPRQKRFDFIPTLSEVASEAGVAISTVSGVLTGKSYCSASDETRRRIVEASEKLGYKANPMARAIHGQQTHTVGLIMPYIASNNVSVMVRQLHVLDQAMAGAGYSTVLSTHQYDPKIEVQHIRDQVSRGVDGILLYPTGQYGPELQELISSSFPLVTIGSTLPVHTWNTTVDRFKGGYLQMKHLLDQGRQRILIMLSNAKGTGVQNTAKQNGRLRALEEAGLAQNPELICPIEATLSDAMQAGAQGIARALDSGVKFDAVITNADTVALGALSTMQARGVRVPDDVALIGFDDDPYAQWTNPPLSTIRQPVNLGTTIFDLLMKQIEARGQGRKLQPQDVALQPELIVRQSTAGTALVASRSMHAK